MKLNHEKALDILKSRVGTPSDVVLEDGRTIRIWNIAWGYDFGESVAHIISNIDQPTPVSDLPEELFYANEIVRIIDTESEGV